jgi:hypothetical protein
MKFYRAKIQKISKPVTSFGGIYFVNREFDSLGVDKLIDKELGTRGRRGTYSYGEIFKTWINIFLCGGECAEDIQVHLRPSLELMSGGQVPSADTLLRGIKELAVQNTETVSDSGKSFNLIYIILSMSLILSFRRLQNSLRRAGNMILIITTKSFSMINMTPCRHIKRPTAIFPELQLWETGQCTWKTEMATPMSKHHTPTHFSGHTVCWNLMA